MVRFLGERLCLYAVCVQDSRVACVLLTNLVNLKVVVAVVVGSRSIAAEHNPKQHKGPPSLTQRPPEYKAQGLPDVGGCQN